MSKFDYIKIPNPSVKPGQSCLDIWVISAPKRAERPKEGRGEVKKCPFCPGNEKEEKEIYRIGGQDHDSNWYIRVLPNKYPFAPIHEIVVHSQDHEKHVSDLYLEQVRLVIEVFVNRYNAHAGEGSVCIFGNSGREAGESLSHPHTQIAVVPKNIPIIIPRLEKELDYKQDHLEVGDFILVCPPYSQWPDEVWIVPNDRGRKFGEIRYEEIESLSYILKRVIKIFEIRHGHDFPYNFYIYPYRDWYMRIMPRAKIPGGFEIATGIFVNTQDPKETMAFLKKHFYEEKEDLIKLSSAEYRRGV